MERRTYLKTVGASVVTLSVSVAGCGEPGAGAETTEGDLGDEESPEPDSPAPEVTETESPEPDSPAPEVTETESPAPDSPAPEVTETEADGIVETTEGDDGVTETTEADGTATGTAGADAVDVAMVTEGSDYYFDPIGLYVDPGQTVTLVNDSGSHSATAYAETNDAASVTRIPSDAEAWDSEIITGEGEEFSHTFEVEGTYDYFCIPHKSLGMVGRIVVGEPGGPATEGEIPNGDVPSSEEIVDQETISWEEFTG